MEIKEKLEEKEKESSIDWRYIMYQYIPLSKEEYTEKHFELLEEFNAIYDRFKKEFEEFEKNKLNDFLKEKDQKFALNSKWGLSLAHDTFVGGFEKFDERFEGYRNE